MRDCPSEFAKSHCILKRSAMGLKASAICARNSELSKLPFHTLQEDPLLLVRVLVRMMMLPLCRQMKSATDATSPFWSGQERSKTRRLKVEGNLRTFGQFRC